MGLGDGRVLASSAKWSHRSRQGCTAHNRNSAHVHARGAAHRRRGAAALQAKHSEAAASLGRWAVREDNTLNRRRSFAVAQGLKEDSGDIPPKERLQVSTAEERHLRLHSILKSRNASAFLLCNPLPQQVNEALDNIRRVCEAASPHSRWGLFLPTRFGMDRSQVSFIVPSLLSRERAARMPLAGGVGIAPTMQSAKLLCAMHTALAIEALFGLSLAAIAKKVLEDGWGEKQAAGVMSAALWALLQENQKLSPGGAAYRPPPLMQSGNPRALPPLSEIRAIQELLMDSFDAAEGHQQSDVDRAQVAVQSHFQAHRAGSPGTAAEGVWQCFDPATGRPWMHTLVASRPISRRSGQLAQLVNHRAMLASAISSPEGPSEESQRDVDEAAKEVFLYTSWFRVPVTDWVAGGASAGREASGNPFLLAVGRGRTRVGSEQLALLHGLKILRDPSTTHRPLRQP
jgi:hypothetical protein